MFNLLKVVFAYKWGVTSDGLNLYPGNLNEVTVSICLISDRSRLIWDCQMGY